MKGCKKKKIKNIIISLIMNFTRKKVVILAAYAITETTDHG
jgi:hypothetical protein